MSIDIQANTLELMPQNASAAMQGHIQSQWALRQHLHALCAQQALTRMRGARAAHAPTASRGQVARKPAETESKPLQKHATMGIRLPAMAATQCAQSSADTLALDSRLCVPLRHVVTDT